ncbi:DUF86 domain-containing protein [bacterium]|nr:DUF86 domain-containing protein [bacterium]
MSKRDYKLYIDDILESIQKIKQYTEDMTFEEFSPNNKTIDAVVRNFEIMGEASKQIPKTIKDKYKDIEWKSLIQFRNVVVHEYFGIDLKIMWDIIKNEIPPLEAKIKKVLKA